LIKNLRARVTCLKILVLSEYEHPLFAERALRAGALGYIAKDSSAEGVIAAIRSVLAGDLHLTESMATRLLRGVVSTDAETSGVSSLSDRQLHVLYLLGAGLSTREIAGASSLSFKTVETHRENLKRKLGLRTASELLRFAYSVAETKLSPEPAGEI
jgi:Response regulator containing a CheY-like receiver domain and an HTH DNA-binding domain